MVITDTYCHNAHMEKCGKSCFAKSYWLIIIKINDWTGRGPGTSWLEIAVVDPVERFIAGAVHYRKWVCMFQVVINNSVNNLKLPFSGVC